jgi:crossover junction endodeoxyribonuclease RuvC
MRILGVDPGTRVTGYGVIDAEGGKLRHVCHGQVHTKPGAPLWDRLKTIHDAIVAVAAEHRPDALSLEQCFVSKNVQSALKLGHTRGAIMVAAMSSGLAVHEYQPSVIKSAVSGSGRADKHQVAQMVRVVLSLPVAAPSDASDALAAAICHAHALSAPLLGRRSR